MKYNIKQILLKKIDRIVNPDFEKYFIRSLFILGGFLIGRRPLIEFVNSLELSLGEYQIKYTFGDEENYILLFIGFILIAIACFLFYKKFNNSSNKKEIPSLKKASKSINKILKENERLHKIHGPNLSSSISRKLKTESNLKTWDKVKKDMLIPNNRKIYGILKRVKKYSDKESLIIEKMLNHIEAFEGHILDSNYDYSENQFPQSFSSLISKYANGGIVKKNNYLHYSNWIRNYIETNDINNLQDMHIFGSTLYGSSKNDIDVLFYVRADFDSYEKIAIMEEEFKKEFKKSMDITLFTESEKKQYEDFKEKLLDIKNI